MEPNMWGPIYWSFLFSTVLGYPLEPGIDIQSAYYRFFRLLEQVLPCGICKANYAEHFRNIPLNFYLYSRKALMEWVLILHNEVNRSLGKPPLMLEQAIHKYLGPKFINCSSYRECINMPNKKGVEEFIPSARIAALDKAESKKEVVKVDDTKEVTVEGFNLNSPPAETGFDYRNIILIIIACLILYWLYKSYKGK